MDLWKYYDLIDAPVAISFLEKLGLHEGVATALAGTRWAAAPPGRP